MIPRPPHFKFSTLWPKRNVIILLWSIVMKTEKFNNFSNFLFFIFPFLLLVDGRSKSHFKSQNIFCNIDSFSLFFFLSYSRDIINILWFCRMGKAYYELTEHLLSKIMCEAQNIIIQRIKGLHNYHLQWSGLLGIWHNFHLHNIYMLQCESLHGDNSEKGCNH